MNHAISIDALAASGRFRHLSTIAGIDIDLRYAGVDNFVGRDLYSPHDCAWLHIDAASALDAVVAYLAARVPSHRILVLDALRPQRVQQQLWDALAGTDLQMYLAAPERGSIHSFGMALDVTIVDQHGVELDMGTGFDDLTAASQPALEALMVERGVLTVDHIGNRQLLRDAMAQAGFQGISTEWWHYDCGDRDRVRQSYARVI